MQLEGEFPAGIVLYIIDNEGGNDGGFAPFGLEEEEAAGVGESGPLLGPVEVGFVVDDHFELADDRGNGGKGGFEFLG